MYYPSLKKLKKAFIKVVKTSRFAFVRIKKMYPRNVHEVDLELGGGKLSLSACPGVGNRPPRKKTLQIPGGSLPEVGGGMVTNQFEPCIITPCYFFCHFIANIS